MKLATLFLICSGISSLQADPGITIEIDIFIEQISAPGKVTIG